MFELQDIAQLNHSANFKDYVSRIEIAVSKSARARSSWAKQSQHEEATKLVSQSRAYGKFFNVKVPKLPSVPALDSEEMQKVRDREARVASAKAEQTRKENSERIERWRNGENVGYLYNLPVMLRIVGEEIETSRGARVPVSHALRGLRFVREVVKRGEAYQRNGHTLHLGNYAIDRIETDGTLKAGCHVIPYAEIERIAPALETAVQS